MSEDVGFAAMLPHDRDVVASIEEAETLLRIHHLCSGDDCLTRGSALAFKAAVTGGRR